MECTGPKERRLQAGSLCHDYRLEAYATITGWKPMPRLQAGSLSHFGLRGARTGDLFLGFVDRLANAIEWLQ
jgi:hypothetical protein